MIELVFAIVIIGIVAISIPTIMVNNSKNVEANLMQEAILIVATKTGQILTYPWDENSRDPLSGILSTTDVLSIDESIVEDELDRNVSDYRRGHVQQALRRRMTPMSAERNATDNTLLGLDAGETIDSVDDLDDLNGQSVSLAHFSAEGYKKDYNISSAVIYVNDQVNYAAAGGITPLNFTFSRTNTGFATNIKMIEISVRAADDAGNWPTQPDILFRSFASNIGETDYYKRTY